MLVNSGVKFGFGFLGVAGDESQCLGERLELLYFVFLTSELDNSI